MNKKIGITALCLLLSICALAACIFLRGKLENDSMTVTPAQTPAQSGDLVTRPTTVATDATAPSARPVGGSDAQSTTATTAATVTTAVPRDGDFAFTEQQTKQLDSMLAGFGGQVAALYTDLETGYTYTYNADKTFSAASLTKAPYCLYLLQLAADGKCDLEQKLTYTDKIGSNGTGIVKKSPFGTQFTVGQLIEYTLRYSDNAALRMLRGAYPANGFQKYAATIGIKNTAAIGLITNSRITANDAAIYMRAIHAFIRDNPTYGGMLHEYMTHSNNKMFASQYPLVRKYGWADKAFHEMALVEAPHPYILVLLTDHEDGTAQDFAMFRNFSKTVEAIANH